MCKQQTPFFVKTIRAADGERLPVLLHRSTGVPDFDATLWVVNSLRNKNHASETITQALRSLVILYVVLQSRKINLNERIGAGKFLDPADIEAISKAARQSVAACATALADFDDSDSRQNNKITSLEQVRMSMTRRATASVVDARTTSIRLGYIREFLKWRINRMMLSAHTEAKANLLILRDMTDKELRNKTPAWTERATVLQRMGIDRQAQEQLLNVVNPTNPNNPWTGKHIRMRNEFIINALLGLGVRRSELLGVRVDDFDPRKGELMIMRRPDDVNDPRLNEPNAKTRDRILPVSSQLYQLMRAYLIQRNEIVRGRHYFLVVANTGDPLSKSEMNRILHALSQVAPALPKITPHVLRHTFFENLADDLHQAGKGDVEILGFLRQLGGWSDASNTPRRYTKRFAQERAMEAGLTLQRKLYIKSSSDTREE